MTESQEHFENTMQEVLSKEIPTENPEELYKFAAIIESYAYYLVKRQAIAERTLAELEKNLNQKKAKIKDFTGTAADRLACWEQDQALGISLIEFAKSDVKYYRNLSRMLENKISLIQSILGNITSSIKAGAYLDGVSSK